MDFKITVLINGTCKFDKDGELVVKKFGDDRSIDLFDN